MRSEQVLSVYDLAAQDKPSSAEEALARSKMHSLEACILHHSEEALKHWRLKRFHEERAAQYTKERDALVDKWGGERV